MYMLSFETLNSFMDTKRDSPCSVTGAQVWVLFTEP